MADPASNLDELSEKLEALLRKQEQFQKEIEELRSAIELSRLRESLATGLRRETPAKTDLKERKEVKTPPVAITPKAREAAPEMARPKNFELNELLSSRLEKFIGENLANKIGIIILIIGVTIGVKYVIDHQLISPLMRIILGYLVGLVLFALAYRLKPRYHNFSAVLLSGSMAIFYFITYAAYEFYGFIAPLPTFLLLVAFTVFTVLAAVRYDRQVIAHIGLVGAYAVPFLVGKDPGQALVLFTYITIINCGVLTVAVQRYWKPLYYAAFILTWLIFGAWYLEDYASDTHFGLGMAFNAVFFIIFYLTFLAYKLIKKKKFSIDDVVALLANAFLFFIIGYLMLDDFPGGTDYQGAFTLGNAFIHFVVSVIIRRSREPDQDLFFMVAGLVLVFITIAIPIQLDGNPVTLLWAGEAALLFWVGRSRKALVYEFLSYLVMILVLGSLFQDWVKFYQDAVPDSAVTNSPAPFFNVQLLTSLFVTAAFGWMTSLNSRLKDNTPSAAEEVLGFFLPLATIVLLFFSFWQEIDYYWNLKYIASGIDVPSNDGDSSYIQRNDDLLRIGNVWKYNYSLFFFALLSLANIYLWKNGLLALLNLILNFLVLGLFLVGGLYELNLIWESYHNQTSAGHFPHGPFHIWLRYLSYVFVGFLLFTNDTYLRKMPTLENMRSMVDLEMHLALLWIASSELVHWLDLADAGLSNKIALSILWGVYAMMLVSLGIWKKKAYLRIAAMVLFAVTLAKLFFYDLVDLDNISKTIIFLSLGSLLLIISFLYNKYRQSIFDEQDD